MMPRACAAITKERIEIMSIVRSLHPPAPAKRRVLVVDDNLDAVHSMATLLKMMGHEVAFAINGFAALDVARKFRPHFVLLDISLPDFKGYDVAQQLKWEPGLEHTRIIAITGLTAYENDRQRAYESGCSELYRKPMDPAVLEKLLARALPCDPPAAQSRAS